MFHGATLHPWAHLSLLTGFQQRRSNVTPMTSKQPREGHACCDTRRVGFNQKPTGDTQAIWTMAETE